MDGNFAAYTALRIALNERFRLNEPFPQVSSFTRDVYLARKLLEITQKLTDNIAAFSEADLDIFQEISHFLFRSSYRMRDSEGEEGWAALPDELMAACELAVCNFGCAFIRNCIEKRIFKPQCACIIECLFDVSISENCNTDGVTVPVMLLEAPRIVIPFEFMFGTENLPELIEDIPPETASAALGSMCVAFIELCCAVLESDEPADVRDEFYQVWSSRFFDFLVDMCSNSQSLHGTLSESAPTIIPLLLGAADKECLYTVMDLLMCLSENQETGEIVSMMLASGENLDSFVHTALKFSSNDAGFGALLVQFFEKLFEYESELPGALYSVLESLDYKGASPANIFLALLELSACNADRCADYLQFLKNSISPGSSRSVIFMFDAVICLGRLIGASNGDVKSSKTPLLIDNSSNKLCLASGDENAYQNKVLSWVDICMKTIPNFDITKILQASKEPTDVCTFTRSGRTMFEHPMYFCYTCNLCEREEGDGSLGVCRTCALNCHKGHDVVFYKTTKFFCDCIPERGDSCKCKEMLRNTAITASSPFESMKEENACFENPFLEMDTFRGSLSPAEVASCMDSVFSFFVRATEKDATTDNSEDVEMEESQSGALKIRKYGSIMSNLRNVWEVSTNYPAEENSMGMKSTIALTCDENVLICAKGQFVHMMSTQGKGYNYFDFDSEVTGVVVHPTSPQYFLCYGDTNVNLLSLHVESPSLSDSTCLDLSPFFEHGNGMCHVMKAFFIGDSICVCTTSGVGFYDAEDSIDVVRTIIRFDRLLSGNVSLCDCAHISHEGHELIALLFSNGALYFAGLDNHGEVHLSGETAHVKCPPVASDGARRIALAKNRTFYITTKNGNVYCAKPALALSVNGTVLLGPGPLDLIGNIDIPDPTIVFRDLGVADTLACVCYSTSSDKFYVGLCTATGMELQEVWGADAGMSYVRGIAIAKHSFGGESPFHVQVAVPGDKTFSVYAYDNEGLVAKGDAFPKKLVGFDRSYVSPNMAAMFPSMFENTIDITRDVEYFGHYITSKYNQRNLKDILSRRGSSCVSGRCGFLHVGVQNMGIRNNVCVGFNIRVRQTGSPLRCLKIFGREIPMNEEKSRWYSVMFTPFDIISSISMQGGKTFEQKFEFTLFGEGEIAIDTIACWGLPRSRFPFLSEKEFLVHPAFGSEGSTSSVRFLDSTGSIPVKYNKIPAVEMFCEFLSELVKNRSWQPTEEIQTCLWNLFMKFPDMRDRTTIKGLLIKICGGTAHFYDIYAIKMIDLLTPVLRDPHAGGFSSIENALNFILYFLRRAADHCTAKLFANAKLHNFVKDVLAVVVNGKLDADFKTNSLVSIICSIFDFVIPFSSNADVKGKCALMLSLIFDLSHTESLEMKNMATLALSQAFQRYGDNFRPRAVELVCGEMGVNDFGVTKGLFQCSACRRQGDLKMVKCDACKMLFCRRCIDSMGKEGSPMARIPQHTSAHKVCGLHTGTLMFCSGCERLVQTPDWFYCKECADAGKRKVFCCMCYGTKKKGTLGCNTLVHFGPEEKWSPKESVLRASFTEEGVCELSRRMKHPSAVSIFWKKPTTKKADVKVGPFLDVLFSTAEKVITGKDDIVHALAFVAHAIDAVSSEDARTAASLPSFQSFIKSALACAKNFESIDSVMSFESENRNVLSVMLFFAKCLKVACPSENGVSNALSDALMTALKGIDAFGKMSKLLPLVVENVPEEETASSMSMSLSASDSLHIGKVARPDCKNWAPGLLLESFQWSIDEDPFCDFLQLFVSTFFSMCNNYIRNMGAAARDALPAETIEELTNHGLALLAKNVSPQLRVDCKSFIRGLYPPESSAYRVKKNINTFGRHMGEVMKILNESVLSPQQTMISYAARSKVSGLLERIVKRKDGCQRTWAMFALEKSAEVSYVDLLASAMEKLNSARDGSYVDLVSSLSDLLSDSIISWCSDFTEEEGALYRAKSVEALKSLLSSERNMYDFVVEFGVVHASDEVRENVCDFVSTMLSCTEGTQHHQTVSNVVKKVLLEVVPKSGKNGSAFMDVVRCMCDEAADDEEEDDESMREGDDFSPEDMLVGLLKQQNRVLATHPQATMYKNMAQSPVARRFIYEAEPCPICNGMNDVSFEAKSVSSLVGSRKSTWSSVLYKFKSPQVLERVKISYDFSKPAWITPRKVFIYTNNKQIKDAKAVSVTELEWKPVFTGSIPRKDNDIMCRFPVPVQACNILIEFGDFVRKDTNPVCFRCGTEPPASMHGICPRCHENIHQCRGCNNINYDHPEFFFCTACGRCTAGKLECTFFARNNDFFTMPIESDEDLAKVMENAEEAGRNAQREIASIASARLFLSSMFDPWN